jgi:hypothetical protein
MIDGGIFPLFVKTVGLGAVVLLRSACIGDESRFASEAFLANGLLLGCGGPAGGEWVERCVRLYSFGTTNGGT